MLWGNKLVAHFPLSIRGLPTPPQVIPQPDLDTNYPEQFLLQLGASKRHSGVKDSHLPIPWWQSKIFLNSFVFLLFCLFVAKDSHLSIPWWQSRIFLRRIWFSRSILSRLSRSTFRHNLGYVSRTIHCIQMLDGGGRGLQEREKFMF